MNNILALDCCTEKLSLCLKKDNLIFTSSLKAGFKHSELLIEEIDSLLRKADLSTKELNLLAVTAGPGSFTALRVGLATAKGISEGAGCPLVSYPGLDIYAKAYNFFEGLVCPLIDGKKQRYYFAFYKDGERQSDYFDLPLEKWPGADYPEKILLCGPDSASFFKKLKENNFNTSKTLAADQGAFNPARALISSATTIFEEQGPASPGSGPLYVRRSEAEEKSN